MRPGAIVLRLLVWLAFLPLAAAVLAADVPYLTGRVVDEAGILSAQARDRISAMSKAHEEKTSNQVVVLTLPTLGGESIEDYATRAFETWKLGQAGKDNGVLLIVVPNDRRMRIEVGYGLEGTLPDAVAARVIRERMTPRFRSGDYDGGVIDGVSAIVDRLEGRASDGAGADAPAASSGGASIFDSAQIREFESDLPPWPMRILLGAFIFGIIGLFTFIGIVTPGVGWFLYVFLIPFWAMFPIVIVGVKGALVLLSLYVVGFPAAKLALRGRPSYRKAMEQMRRTGRATIGGMVISSGGSSSGGSSGGGGGFSGGGGSSGGGGASGSW
jgi:uncharacterized protein